MNTTIMEYCVDLAEMKNFTRVAEKHFISQQGLSFHIKNLEKELGVPLFVRTRHSVEVTPAGEAFVAEAKKAIRYTNSAYEVARYLGKVADNSLSLGSAGISAKNRATVLIRQFMIHYPQVRVNFQHGFYDDIIDDFFRNEKYDLIVTRNLISIDRRVFDWRECHAGLARAVLGKDHPFAKKGSVTREELFRIPHIELPCKTSSALEARKKWLTQILGAIPTNVITASGVDTADMMVACGMGYILLGEDLKEQHQVNQFAYVPIEGVEQRFPLWYIWRRDNSKPELANFLEVIRDFE